jgi:hypothetical protein
MLCARDGVANRNEVNSREHNDAKIRISKITPQRSLAAAYYWMPPERKAVVQVM